MSETSNPAVPESRATAEGASDSAPPASASSKDSAAPSAVEAEVVEAEVSPASGEKPVEVIDAVEEEVDILDPLEEAQAEAVKFKEQLLRTAADFDNFRKRSRKEVTDAARRGRSELLLELLPVFDNLERATAHAASAKDVKSLADGVSMVMRQFTDTLNKLSISRIETVGKPFDPSVHEAIQQQETADFEPGTIAAEVQGGYRQGDAVIRPAMVVVAKALPTPEPAEEAKEESSAADGESAAAGSEAPAESEGTGDEGTGDEGTASEDSDDAADAADAPSAEEE